MMYTLWNAIINHLAFASSVREAKLFDAANWLLDNSSREKRIYLRTNACKTQQKVLQPIKYKNMFLEVMEPRT